MRRLRLRVSGFTLAELLIALAILGVIAVFTIPKILQANQSAKYNAAAKEAIATVAAAYQQYHLSGKQTPSTVISLATLTPYMNYISIDTTGDIDNFPYGTPYIQTCTVTSPCLNLHNGGKLMLYANHFGTGETTILNFFFFDPDGVSDPNPDGPGKSVKVALYYDGFVTSRPNVRPGSTDASGNPFAPGASGDPIWFKW